MTALARADVVYTFQVTEHPSDHHAAETRVEKIHIKGERVRWEHSDEAAEIIDLVRDQIIYLDKRTKTAAVKTLDEWNDTFEQARRSIRAQFAEQARPASTPPLSPASSDPSNEQPMLSTFTGGSEQIQGYTCTKIELRSTLKAIHAWVSRDVPAADEFRRFIQRMKLMFPGVSFLSDVLDVYGALTDHESFPVQIETELFGDGRVSYQQTMILQDIDRTPLGDNIFNIPEDYQQDTRS